MFESLKKIGQVDNEKLDTLFTANEPNKSLFLCQKQHVGGWGGDGALKN